jgi:hypothetical protein
MSLETIFVIGGVITLAILFLIARLAIRWMVRLLIIGIVLIALLAGGLLLWWTTRLAPLPPPRKPAPTRRTS